MLRATCLCWFWHSSPRTPSAPAAFDRRSATRLLLFFAAIGFGFGASPSSASAGAIQARPTPSSPRDVASRFHVDPNRLILQGPNCRYSLLVSDPSTDRRTVDLTRAALYRSKNASIVEIGPDGVAQSVSDGETQIEVTIGREKRIVPVRVTGSHAPRSLHFEK